MANRAVTLLKDEAHLFPIPNRDGPCLVLMSEGAFSTRGETLARDLRRQLPALKTFVTNSAMPDGLLAAIAAQTSQCKQIYAATFVTVAANRGSVALEGGLGQFLKTLVHGTVPVALLAFGNPYLLRDVPEVSTYVALFSTATTSESAAAQAILGEIPITGKMPVSIPGLAKIGDGLRVAAQPRAPSN